MKVVVIGAEGQLGTELCHVYADTELERINHRDLDVRDADGVHALICDKIRPQVVINTAAAHNLDHCEEDPETAFAVNAVGAKNVAQACARCGARVVHVSTDYVFGDTGTRPFVEDDPPAALSVYGASKLAGEHLVASYCTDHAIVRTGAIYGPAPCRAKEGRNFVDLMLHLAATRPELKVKTDEVVTPTYTVALAKQIQLLAERGKPGIYHVTCNGSCSWYDFAKAIFEETGTEANLFPATNADFPSPIRRPLYSVLENRHLREQGLDVMPEWREALRTYLRTASK